MKFSHPLARGARFAHVENFDAGDEEVLVVFTTLHLEPSHKKHKPEKVERLREAAKEFLKEKAPAISKIMLLNPE